MEFKEHDSYLPAPRVIARLQTAETLCRGLPALAEYLTYVRGLAPGEPADYARAELIFTDGLRRRGFPADVPFDWMKQKKQAHHHHHHPVAAKSAATANNGATAAVKPLAVAPGRLPVGGGTAGRRMLDTAALGSSPRKRPRAGSDASPGGLAVPPAGFGSGRGPGNAAAVFDLYADIPPPEEGSPAVSVSGGGRRGTGTAGESKEGFVATIEPPAATAMGDLGIKGTPSRLNGAALGQKMAAGGIAGTVSENAAVNGRGATAVDVSVALGKLRPHLKGGRAGSKKFPKACGLLTDLLCAKLGPENEEVFFDVICDAVACGGGGGGGDASCSSAADGSSKAGRSGPEELVLPLAGGVLGDAVRRLVAAAGSRSAIFSGPRREVVEAWAKQI